jgi:hypothetical protein
MLRVRVLCAIERSGGMPLGLLRGQSGANILLRLEMRLGAHDRRLRRI